MTSVHFIRHGQVDDPSDVFYGRLPGFPLSEDGASCIEYIGKRLKERPISAIYHSPLLRSKQSADILLHYFSCPQMIDERITEVGTKFEGVSRDYLRQNPPTPTDYTETMEEIYVRMADFLRDIAAAHDNEEIIVVSHGGPIRILEIGLQHLPFTDRAYESEGAPVCGSDTVVTVQDGEFTVTRTEL